jgi:hypothetical protein
MQTCQINIVRFDRPKFQDLPHVFFQHLWDMTFDRPIVVLSIPAPWQNRMLKTKMINMIMNSVRYGDWIKSGEGLFETGWFVFSSLSWFSKNLVVSYRPWWFGGWSFYGCLEGTNMDQSQKNQRSPPWGSSGWQPNSKQPVPRLLFTRNHMQKTSEFLDALEKPWVWCGFYEVLSMFVPGWPFKTVESPRSYCHSQLPKSGTSRHHGFQY